MSRSLAIAAAFVALLGPLAARAQQELAVYPGAVHTRIGADLVIGGQLHRMAYFLTDDPVRKVARHFHEAWVKQGLPTTLNVAGEDELVVSSFQTRQGLQRSVILRRHGHKTLGFTVLKDLWLETLPPTAPLQTLENTLLSSDVVARDDGGHTQHRSQVIEGTLADVSAELGRRLEAEGFTRVRASRDVQQGKARLTLEYGRRGEQMVSVLSEMGEGTLAVLQTWVGSDRADAVANDAALGNLRRRETKR